MKSICIYHSRDLDGWMSAAIVKKSFLEHNSYCFIEEVGMDDSIGSINVIDSTHFKEDVTSDVDHEEPILHMLGWDYGNVIPDLSTYDKVVMCDISLPVEVMEKIAPRLIWIDHHISAMNMMDNSEEFTSKVHTRFTQSNFAACELTWFHFFPDETIPEIVRLLGRYDCFGHKGTDEEQDVLEFQYGARQRIDSYTGAYNALILPASSNLIGHILNDGKATYAYLKTEAKQTYAKAFPVELKENYIIGKRQPGMKIDLTDGILEYYDRKFLCVNQERFNPINFGIDYHKEGYDGFACFWFNKGKWSFSLYNDNGNVDCSVIAKSFGGGGHKGAAGFVVEDLSIVIQTNSK